MLNTLTQEKLRMRKSIIMYIYIIVYRYRTDITNPVENMIRLDPSQLSTAWTQDVVYRPQEIHSVVVLLGLSFFGFVWGLTGASSP